MLLAKRFEGRSVVHIECALQFHDCKTLLSRYFAADSEYLMHMCIKIKSSSTTARNVSTSLLNGGEYTRHWKLMGKHITKSPRCQRSKGFEFSKH